MEDDSYFFLFGPYLSCDFLETTWLSHIFIMSVVFEMNNIVPTGSISRNMRMTRSTKVQGKENLSILVIIRIFAWDVDCGPT